MKWLHLHSSVRWFHFYVQGSGARLVLSADYRDSKNAYHIAIGAKHNTEFAIYRGNVLVKTYSESNILSVTEFEEFWLSWDGGLIQLGRTKYRVNIALISYQDPLPMAVKAVAVHGGSESYGDWKFSTNIGKYTLYALVDICKTLSGYGSWAKSGNLAYSGNTLEMGLDQEMELIQEI